ncbi:unnamed protein product [Rangifer tarandus platyrhynchus]|uniref:Secreted protein n=1 Tax=Rangifer tarandus platyrhynchus TaxID=3082113 RepID=A0ABN8Y0Q3_RANTA|nr:unnamed protein product [Rangifer tarandus platyrhynchus]
MLFLLMVLTACVSFCAVGRTFHPPPPPPAAPAALKARYDANSRSRKPPAMFLRGPHRFLSQSADQERLPFLGSQGGPGQGWRVDFRPRSAGVCASLAVSGPVVCARVPGWPLSFPGAGGSFSPLAGDEGLRIWGS